MFGKFLATCMGRKTKRMRGDGGGSEGKGLGVRELGGGRWMGARKTKRLFSYRAFTRLLRDIVKKFT